MHARAYLVLALLSAGWNAAAADAARGAYLVHAGGCIACHLGASESPNDLSGGLAIESPFGTFYTPNITPDVDTGIGAWSDDTFVAAMREGLSPSGAAYYPAFPYVSYSALTDQDLEDLKAYLDTLPPVNAPNREHELVWYLNRYTMRVWQWLFFEPHTFDPDTFVDAPTARGAYLVRHLGHCGECHTPRNTLGVPDPALELAGNPDGPGDEAIPNITPDRETGIGKWSTSDIVYMLTDGMLPDGDFTGGSMSEVIDYNTSNLTEADRTAIATYLKSLPATPSAVSQRGQTPP